MNDFQKNVLEALIKKYDRSVLSKKGSNRHLSITLTSKDGVLKNYDAPDSYLYSECYDRELKELDSQGYIVAQFGKYGKFQSLSLNVNRVEDIYNLLKINSPQSECKKYVDFLSTYHATGFLKKYIEEQIETINESCRVPKSLPPIEEMSTIFDIIECMKNQEDEIMERDFSIAHLGDSKRFAEIRNKVCRIIYDYDFDYPYTDEFNEDEILSYFNITKNSSTAIIKKNLVFKVGSQDISLNRYHHDFCLSDEAIKEMTIFDSTFKSVITIENLTTFKQYKNDEAVIIYLGGFNNHTKQLLLKKIYDKFPNVGYYHFSDIDCGGFLIFNHLKESTGIPFKPLFMGVEDMRKDGVILKELTSNDEKRLKKMLNDNRFSIFFDVIEYMLQTHKKVEQETFDRLAK